MVSCISDAGTVTSFMYGSLISQKLYKEKRLKALVNWTIQIGTPPQTLHRVKTAFICINCGT